MSLSGATPKERWGSAASELAELDWSLFGTLTFRHDEVSPGTAHARLKRWSTQLARSVFNTHLQVLWSCGPQEHRFRATPHFHVAVRSMEPGVLLVAHLAASHWRHGDAKVEPFDPSRGIGGLTYILEHAVRDMAVACPEGCNHWRRGRRCPVAKAPWPSRDSMASSWLRRR
jgi:hypothetical protein